MTQDYDNNMTYTTHEPTCSNITPFLHFGTMDQSLVRSAPQITTCSAPRSTSQITDIHEITEYTYFDNPFPREIDYIRNNLLLLCNWRRVISKALLIPTGTL